MGRYKNAVKGSENLRKIYYKIEKAKHEEKISLGNLTFEWELGFPSCITLWVYKGEEYTSISNAFKTHKIGNHKLTKTEITHIENVLHNIGLLQ